MTRGKVTPRGVEFGVRLLKLRESMHMTQRQFQQSLGLNANALGGDVSAWECGASFPRVATLISICERYNVSADELLGLK